MAEPTLDSGTFPPSGPGGEAAIQSLEEALTNLKATFQSVWQVAGQFAQIIGQQLAAAFGALTKNTVAATAAIGGGPGGGGGFNSAVQAAGKSTKELGVIASAVGFAFDSILLKAVRAFGDYVANVLSPNLEGITGGIGKLDASAQRANVAIKTLATAFERGQAQALEPFKRTVAAITEGLARLDPQLVSTAGYLSQIGANAATAASVISGVGLSILSIGAAVQVALPLLNKLGTLLGSQLLAHATDLKTAFVTLGKLGVATFIEGLEAIISVLTSPLSAAILATVALIGTLTYAFAKFGPTTQQAGESVESWLARIRKGNEDARRLAEAYDKIRDSITLATESLRAAREESTALARGDASGAAAAVNRLNAIKLEIQQRQEQVALVKQIMDLENRTREQAEKRAEELTKEERLQQEISKLTAERNTRLDEQVKADQASLIAIERQVEFARKLLEIDNSRSQGRQLAAETERDRAAGARDLAAVLAEEKKITDEVLKRQQIAHEDRQLQLRELEERRVREVNRQADIITEQKRLEAVRDAGFKTAETAEAHRVALAKELAELNSKINSDPEVVRRKEALQADIETMTRIRDQYLQTGTAAKELAKADEDVRIRLENSKKITSEITAEQAKLNEEESGQLEIQKRQLEVVSEINKAAATEMSTVRATAELEEARLKTAERRLQVQQTQSETRTQAAAQAGTEAELTGNVPQLIEAARQQTDEFYEQRRIRIEELGAQQRRIADEQKQTQAEISILEREQLKLREMGRPLDEQSAHALEMKKQLMVDLGVQQRQSNALVEKELADRNQILTAQRELQQLRLQRPQLEQARADAVLNRAAANFGGDLTKAVNSGSGAGIDPARFEEQYKRAAKQIAEIINKPQLSEADIQMLGVQAGIAESATQRQQQFGRGGSAIGAPEVRRREQEIADVREKAATRALELNEAQIKAKEEEIRKGKEATEHLDGAATRLHTAGSELIEAAKVLKDAGSRPPSTEGGAPAPASEAKPGQAEQPQAAPAKLTAIERSERGEEVPMREYLEALPKGAFGPSADEPATPTAPAPAPTPTAAAVPPAPAVEPAAPAALPSEAAMQAVLAALKVPGAAAEPAPKTGPTEAEQAILAALSVPAPALKPAEPAPPAPPAPAAPAAPAAPPAPAAPAAPAAPPAPAAPAAPAAKVEVKVERDPFQPPDLKAEPPKPLRDPFQPPELPKAAESPKPPVEAAPPPKPEEPKKPTKPTEPIYAEPIPRTEGEKAGWATGMYPTGERPRVSASGKEMPSGDVQEYGRVYEGPTIKREDMAKTQPSPKLPPGYFTGEPEAVREVERSMLDLSPREGKPYEIPRQVHERSRTERGTPAPAEDEADAANLMARARKAPQIPGSSIRQGESHYTGKTSFTNWDLDDPQGRGARELSWTPGQWATEKKEPTGPQPPPVKPDFSSISTAGKEAIAKGQATADVGAQGQVTVKLGEALDKAKKPADEIAKSLKGVNDVKLDGLQKLGELLQKSGTYVTAIKTGFSSLSGDIDKATESLDKYMTKLQEVVRIAGTMPDSSSGSSGSSVDASQPGTAVNPTTTTNTGDGGLPATT